MPAGRRQTNGLPKPLSVPRTWALAQTIYIRQPYEESMNTDYQSPLSSRYAVDIISMIYENEKIMATDMLRIAKNYKTVIKTADELVELGIMEMHLEAGRRLMKIYQLTPKGKAIGRRMFESREIFYGRMDFDEPIAEVKEKKSKKGKKS